MNKTPVSRTPLVVAAASLAFSLLPALPARADVHLPHVIASAMVVQRDAPIPLWGWADPGEEVQCELGPSKASATADADGHWLVKLPALPAGGPFELTVRGHNTLKLTGILVGEVWLCSGQSNMEMGIAMSKDAKTEVAAADHPDIHLFLVPKTKAGLPMPDVDAKWKVCTPATVAEGGWNGFSAAAYYFGREIQEKLHVPVGLIESTWGGTRIEPWTPPEGFAAVPSLAPIGEEVKRANETYDKAYGAALNQLEASIAEARKAIAEHKPYPVFPQLTLQHQLNSEGRPTGLYNGMIHPLVPFGIRGAIWYQGESNNGDGMRYFEKMQGLIAGWRKLWNEGDFPFYFVQIAPFNYGPDATTREPGIWNAQLASLSIPNTGMAVTTDIATLHDIHPPDKQDVGHRLALWALAKTYGKSDIVFSGPVYKSMKVDGDKIIVTFDSTGTGLATRDGKDVSNFEISGADGKFVAAQARLDGDRVIVSAEGLAAPAQVRFAWDQLAQPNLINKEQLPASPFSSADLPKTP
jgi:sialate O-acetylesterase